MLAWSDELSVDILEIDNDHKKMVWHLESLFSAHQQGLGFQVLRRHLVALLEETRVHFAHEIDIMSRNHCPQIHEHRALHAELISILDDVLEQIDRNPSQGVSEERLGFLQHALVQHILVEDKKIGEHMGVVY